ncbi:MAG: hypothetical protein H7343_22760 [Undibacterium sp.]|nr:hypothetical protein [Opitutaceae bacterium]
MKRSATLILITCASVLLAGCTSIPPGLTKAQWNALSPQQRTQYAAANNDDRRGFTSHITSLRSDADSTLRSLNPTQFTLSPDPSSTR